MNIESILFSSDCPFPGCNRKLRIPRTFIHTHTHPKLSPIFVADVFSCPEASVQKIAGFFFSPGGAIKPTHKRTYVRLSVSACVCSKGSKRAIVDRACPKIGLLLAYLLTIIALALPQSIRPQVSGGSRRRRCCCFCGALSLLLLLPL